MTKLEKKRRKKKQLSRLDVDALLSENLKKKFDVLSVDYSRMELLVGVANLWPWQQEMMKKIEDGAVFKSVTGRTRNVPVPPLFGTRSGRFKSDGPNEANVGKSIQHYNRLQRGDAHSEAAAELFGVPVENVTPEQRAEGKRRNFMRMYSSPSTISGLSPTLMIVDELAGLKDA